MNTRGLLPNEGNFKLLIEDLKNYKFENIDISSMDQQTINICDSDESCCKLDIVIKNNNASEINYK